MKSCADPADGIFGYGVPDRGYRYVCPQANLPGPRLDLADRTEHDAVLALHYPCGTTLVNIWKETKSVKWTFLSFAIPTAIAIGATFLVTQVARALGWV